MIDDKSIVAIIPVRGGSKGVPGKNLRKIQGETLLANAIKKAKRSKYIDSILVSSEDPELIKEALASGAEVPFIRPAELAQDDTPSIEPVLHAMSQIQPYNYVVLLQVTSPLCTEEDIDNCIYFCHANQAPACVTVTEPDHPPFWSFKLSNEKQIQALFPSEIKKRRQELPEVYALNGAVYIARYDWLIENKTFVTNETLAHIMPRERSLDIDSELDFIIMKSYLTS